MEGISLNYRDPRRHSFLGRQLRGLLLFSATIVVWVAAVALSVFSGLLTESITHGIPSPLVRGLLKITLAVAGMVLALFVLALIYRVPRPGAHTWSSFLPERLWRPYCGQGAICSLEPTSRGCNTDLSTEGWRQRSG